MLTPRQVELLGWILQNGDGEVLLVPVDAPEAIAIIPSGPRRTVRPADFRELVEQGLVRHVSKQMHEVTNAGRQEFEKLRPPPAENTSP